jgi:hypothetical protein
LSVASASGDTPRRNTVYLLSATDVVPGKGVFFARQASEQYFTSSQFLAQLLRQVIALPQVWQVLLGSDDLLPLNPTAQPKVLW